MHNSFPEETLQSECLKIVHDVLGVSYVGIFIKNFRLVENDETKTSHVKCTISFSNEWKEVHIAGVGYGMGFLTPNVPAHSVHGFFGVAIPIWTPKKGHLLYVEPYYRPTWDVSDNDGAVGHELGMMIKWLFGFGAK